MNDKELADRIVALGVGLCLEGRYFINISGDAIPVWHSALGDSEEIFVRDWRVCGALITKCYAAGLKVELGMGTNDRGKTYKSACWVYKFNHEDWSEDSGYEELSSGFSDKPPRAICEACAVALEGS